MPGRTPPEAFKAFIEPITSAVSCLGQAKITCSAGGQHAPEVDHAWSINNERGFSSAGFHFEAIMNYRIVPDDREQYGPWRVKTLAYRYRLAVPEHDVFRLHWHPAGVSRVNYPHLHAALSPMEKLTNSLDAHLPTDRMSLERAMQWAFELGMPAKRDDWPDVLAAAEAKHLLYRSWDKLPPKA